MTEISFTSTFRIPITQPGINNSKKLQLRALVGAHNGLIGSGKQGYARISMPDSDDDKFIRKLRQIGYSRYQRFDGENIPNENLDAFIKQKLDTRDYNQKGTNMKPMTREMKEQRRYDRRFTPSVKPEEETEAIESIEKKVVETVTPKPVKKVETKKELPTMTKRYDFGKEDAEKARIRETEAYKQLKEKYGEEFAEAVYFAQKRK